MKTQQRFDVLLQPQLNNIFTNVFPLFSEVFTNILKIHKLPKIRNERPKYSQILVITIIYQEPMQLLKVILF